VQTGEKKSFQPKTVFRYILVFIFSLKNICLGKRKDISAMLILIRYSVSLTYIHTLL